MSAASSRSREIRDCCNMHSGALAERKFGKRALHLGQVTWRVFASSETGMLRKNNLFISRVPSL